MIRKLSLPMGLTLVEVLVSMVIAGGFYLALYSFYRLHAGVLKAAETAIGVQESSRLALDFLVRELHLAGARPVRGGLCVGFERLLVAEEQTVTLQYDFRGDSSGDPPDGCPDDPGERITYTYRAHDKVLRRGTGSGAPQPFINDVPPDGFLLRYFDREGDELAPPLAAAARAAVRSVIVTIRTSKPHPDPRMSSSITAELSSIVFLPNPPT